MYTRTHIYKFHVNQTFSRMYLLGWAWWLSLIIPASEVQGHPQLPNKFEVSLGLHKAVSKIIQNKKIKETKIHLLGLSTHQNGGR